MRWSYKTVHYELKKEGILGSAFLDESEIELSLNQYGKAGWELVSLLETMDGLIAIFKQPLDLELRSFSLPADATAKNQRPRGPQQERPQVIQALAAQKSALSLRGDGDDRHTPGGRPGRRDLRDEVPEAILVDDFEEEKPVKRESTPTKQADIGSIRIE